MAAKYMPFALVTLLAAVAAGRGGYAPWSALVLELGAAALVFWTLAEVIRETSPTERSRLLEARRARGRLPFLARRPGIGRLVRLLSFGLISRRSASATVEILPPGGENALSGRALSESWLLLGYPLRRTGLEAPLAALTIWIAVSLVPLPREWLASLSPLALDLRLEVAALADAPPPQLAPWSLAPFLTWRSLWLWLGYVGLFYVSAHLAERTGTSEKLARLLLLVGAALGAYGVAQALLARQAPGVIDPLQPGLEATGSFDNRNHYALFMEMLLLSSLGWLGARWVAASRPGNRGPAALKTQEARARLSLHGVGVALLGLGLLVSMSRSGIAFSLLGCAAFGLLSRQRQERLDGGDLVVDSPARAPGRELRRASRSSASHLYWALGLSVVALIAWVGFEPIVRRFELLPRDWSAELGRWRVWRDGAGALGDFWLTGSGLSSFRYVFPLYRSFGGVTFYSWAHNDYLQLLLELGIPGLAILAWLIAAAAVAAFRVRETLAASPPSRLLQGGFCAAAFTAGLHSLTDFGLHMPANAALLSVIVGMAVGVKPSGSEKNYRRV
jgi:O-antigen ligase